MSHQFIGGVAQLGRVILNREYDPQRQYQCELDLSNAGFLFSVRTPNKQLGRCGVGILFVRKGSGYLISGPGVSPGIDGSLTLSNPADSPR